MDLKVTVGGNIMKRRKELGYSQESLAEITGLDRTYVQSIEAGKRNISIQVLYTISIALKIEIADLFKDCK
jgi:transcriptional regulator with XRE-family HTH domain